MRRLRSSRFAPIHVGTLELRTLYVQLHLLIHRQLLIEHCTAADHGVRHEGRVKEVFFAMRCLVSEESFHLVERRIDAFG